MYSDIGVKLPLIISYPGRYKEKDDEVRNKKVNQTEVFFSLE